MKRTSLLAFLFLASITAQAYEPSLVHQHYVKWMGVLPGPYHSIEIEIALDPKTDDVKHFEILIGENPVTFSQEDLAKLKDLELGQMQVWEGIHRTFLKTAALGDTSLKALSKCSFIYLWNRKR